jgi:DNA polymerase I-like protein with 3'-5' exonuclease and polymerase domains
VSNDVLIGMKHMEAKLLHLLLDKNTIIIAQNMKFELLVMYEHFPVLRDVIWTALDEGRLFCTKLYEKLLNNVKKQQIFRMGLSDLVSYYFDEDISETKTDPDAWRLRYSELDGVPLAEWPKEAVEYSIQDSIWAYKIYKKQINTQILEYNLAVKSEFALNLMAQKGILVDKERVQLLKEEIEQKLYPNYELLQNMQLVTFNEKTGKYGKNYKKFKEYIQENVEVPLHTAKGSISVTKESLTEYLAKKDDVVIKSFLNIAEYEKVLTAYVSNLLAADPVIRTEYNSVVSSGRTSSYKSRLYPSVNIQQMPRGVEGVTWDVRNCYIPRPGFQLVAIDYSGLELASTAHQLYSMFRESKMREKINEGSFPVDMHSMFACKLKSINDRKMVSYEEFVSKKKETGYKEFRQLAKPINLGFPGGIGYDTIRGLLLRDGVKTKFTILAEAKSERDIDALLWRYKKDYPLIRKKRLNADTYALVLDELVGTKKALFDLYPELREFLQQTHKKFITKDVINKKNEFGEWETEPVYKFDTHGVRRNWCTYTSFCNGYLMQTPSAVGAKNVMYDIIKKYNLNEDMNPLAFIHDEIVFEVRDTPKKYDVIADVADIMILGMQATLPSVRISVEADLMDYWKKSGGEWTKTYWRDQKGDTLCSN